MKKLEMYTIYNITKGDLNKELNDSDLCDREINLQSNNLLRKYLVYKGLEEKDQFLEGIIKLLVPKFETVEETVEFLKEGITFNNKRYIPLISSPSMMKKEGVDDYEKEEFKTEYLYILESEKDFIEIFEDITSLGKLTEKRKNKESLAINKDVIARLSLNTSSSYPINYKPNIVIIPSTTYTYKSNYCYFKDGDYSNLEYIKDHKGEHEFQDGCGLMSCKLAGEITRQLQLDYPIDFAGVRADLGLAVKGLLVKVDFNAYFNEMYKRDNKGVFEKREDGFYTKDYFGKMVNISKADMIITPNMAKWSKWWKQENSINIMEAIDKELESEKYNGYRDILRTFSVTTFNKRQPKEYSLTNYQLISNLALLPSELTELQQETYDAYDKVLDMDIKTIKLMLNDIAKDDITELGAMDKVHYLLQSTEEALTIPQVRKQIVKMVRKKINELAEGRFYVRGNYKIASTCPITFMDWIIYRDLEKCTKGLGVGEFYIPQEKGNRVMSRNPLNSFSEIGKFTIAKNELIEKYCGKLTSEIIFFNQKDDRAMLNSGEDFDTDRNLVIDNEIIYDAVIEPEDGYNFINIQDNKETVEHEYTKENEYYCVIKAGGNLIGSISNIGIRICTNSTELGYYFPKSGKTFGYLELEEICYETKKEYFKKNIKEIKQRQEVVDEIKDRKEWIIFEKDESVRWQYECELENLEDSKYHLEKEIKNKKKEYFTNKLAELIKNDSLIPMETMEDEKIRELIIKQFYKNKRLSYYALELQMLSIDIPKTLKEIDEDLIKALKKECIEKKEPNFKKYSMVWEDRKDKNGREKYFSQTHSILNLHSKKIANELMVKAVKVNEKTTEYAKSDRVTCTNNILGKATATNDTDSVANLFKSIWTGWCSVEERLRAEYKDNKRKKNEELRKNNLITSKAIMELSKKYDINTLGSALLQVSKGNKSSKRTQFILNCCFGIIQELLDIYFNDITIFKEAEDGKYHFMFKNYDEVKATRKQLNLQQKEMLEESIKQDELIPIKFRPIDLEKKIISKKEDKFYINDEPIFNNKVKKGVVTFELLDKLIGNETEIEVKFDSYEEITAKNNSKYIVAYIQ